MIPAATFEGRDVAVFGLGASGLATAAALNAGGARAHCWDDNEESRARAAAKGFTVTDLNARSWSDFAALVVAPGVPLTAPKPHRLVELARMTGVEVLGDIELFARIVNDAPVHTRPKIIGITGTNGKSTTTALLGHIVSMAGRDAQVGGNFGRPVLDLDTIHAGAVYVLELSSFQLDLVSSLRADAAILLNIAPDHLDRHGTMENYICAKRRIFANQTTSDVAIIGVDDPDGQKIATAQMKSAAARTIPVSAGRALGRGAHAVGGVLYDAIETGVKEVVDLRAARALTGRHNWQNAAAAYAAARAVGIEPDAIAKALLSFPGLEHRMEEVARVGEVRFINDSKATNPAAARQALASFENVYWIAGGRAKGGAFTELAPLMSRVTKAYLIGESAEVIATELRDRALFEISRTLEAALTAAARDALSSDKPNPIVLLSPACASFDQFASFGARGDAFRTLARSLPNASLEHVA